MRSILELFKKTQIPLEAGGINKFDEIGMTKCPKCQRFVKSQKLLSALMVCPLCGNHMRLSARNRIKSVADRNSVTELYPDIVSVDPLNFFGYAEKLQKAKQVTGENEAVICADIMIKQQRCAIFAMESGFMMGSMGSAVGEKLTRLFEYASDHSLPVVGFCASGGARMQEGILSLMQMAKVSSAVKVHGTNGNLYVSVLTDPTTGGVSASFAFLGDIIFAEPGALIGFAGRRVIEQTTKNVLPDDFQSAERLLDRGFIDAIIPRDKMKETLYQILKLHDPTHERGRA